MSGPLCGPDDMKSSIDRQTRTSLDHHRQAHDRLGSMDRADDGRRGHKTGTDEVKSAAMQRHITKIFKNMSTFKIVINE